MTNFSYLKDQSNHCNSVESILSQLPEECTEGCGNPSPESPKINAGSEYIAMKDPSVNNTGPTQLPSSFNDVRCRSIRCVRGDQNKTNSLPAGIKLNFA